MSLRAKLTWAFVAVVFVALVLAFAGFNIGLYTGMGRMMHRGMMGRQGMMAVQPGPPWARPPEDYPGTLRWSLVTSLAAFAVAGGVGAWTAGKITRSLRHLTEAAQHLALRDLSRRVPVEGDDEIAELARTFNRMGERLEAEERARRQLLADTAHELRHPLAVLKGRLDLMQDGKVPLEQEALLPLQDEVIRLTRLVGDLRDLSLAEVGGLSLHLTRVDLRELLTGLVSNLEAVAEGKAIQLTAEISDDLPPIQADPDRIRQVFVNLLSNALQYTPEGGRVGLIAQRTAGGQIRVSVTDTGPGIPPEDLPLIFDRFYRSDKSRSRATGGSGLGLAIVRSLVELHRGRVEVRSQVGIGTTFLVFLPV